MKNLLKNYHKRRLFWIIRGHRELKKTDSQGKIYQVMSEIVSTKMIPNKNYSKKLFGVGINNAESISCQYLVSRIIVGVRFSSSLLYTCKKPNAWVTYPLPSEWRKVVRRHGFKMPELLGSLIWICFVIIVFVKGLSSIVKYIFNAIKELYSHSEPKFDSYVYFVGLTKNNIPHATQGEISYDIISWYSQWSGRIKNIKALCHSVKNSPPCTIGIIPVVSTSSIIPPLTNIKTLGCYISWALVAISLCIIDLFRGRWWHALLLEEASISAVARMQSAKKLASDYLFHNSNYVYRPMWTYEAAKKGSKITCYFYSTASGNGFKRENGDYPPPYVGYSIMDWPHYLVWDNYQANAIYRLLGKHVNVSVVGPIWFHSSGAGLPALPDKAIAVFDVQPVRDSLYKSFGVDFDYYTPSTAIQFLLDIEMVLTQLGCQLIFKGKRNIGRLAHPRYRKFIKNLAKSPGMVSIDPDISAVKLIKNCIAVVSMPFTSTAILAKELGKPSIYYDPHGLIQKDDEGAHGVDILCGPKELARWITMISSIKTSMEVISD